MQGTRRRRARRYLSLGLLLVLVLPAVFQASGSNDSPEASLLQQVLPTLPHFAQQNSAVGVLPLIVPKGQPPLWAVYTQGSRPYSIDELENHLLLIYRLQEGKWQELDRIELETPDYVFEGALQQVELEPSRIWLQLESGLGAHAGGFDLLSFADEQLSLEVSHINSSPDAGELRDLNGDGVLELILNQTNNYVFCYACGVRWPDFNVLRWDGKDLREITFTPIEATPLTAVQVLNNRAVALARGRLWKQAREITMLKEMQRSQSEVVRWNIALIELFAQTSADLAKTSAYPLLSQVFYGDYDAALKPFRSLSPAEIFSQDSPLIQDSVAASWPEELANWLDASTTPAVQVAPELAAAHFLRAWARFLLGDKKSSLQELKNAADLAPSDKLFLESLTFMRTAR